MTDYAKVQTKLWHDPRFGALTDRGRLFYLYLLTCPHRNLEGLYVLPLGYAAADLGWDLETVGATVAETVDQRLIGYDETVSLVYIVESLRYQSPANPNMVKAALSKLEALPDSPLLARFYGDALRYAEPLAERLPQRFAEHQTTTRPLPNPSTSTATQNGIDPDRRPDSDENDGTTDWSTVTLDAVELRAPTTPAELHGFAMLAAGYANPAPPTAGEIRTIERALGRGWPRTKLVDLAATAADKTNPKAYLVAAWQDLANTDPTVDPNRRPAIPEFVPDGAGIDTDAAPSGLAAARERLSR